MKGAELLDHHRFGEITGLIHVGTFEYGDVIGQQLQGLKTLRSAKHCKLAPTAAAAYHISGISFRNADRTERIGERADHSITAALQHMGINLRGADILFQILNPQPQAFHQTQTGTV